VQGEAFGVNSMAKLVASRLLLTTSCCGFLFAAAGLRAADPFTFDSRTTDVAGSGITTNKLMQDGFNFGWTNNASSNGSAIWFVIDTLNDGVPTNVVTLSHPYGAGYGPGGMLGPDDVLFWVDNVDGSLPGSRAGVFNRAAAWSPILDRSALSASNHYIMYLWGFGYSPTLVAGTNAFSAEIAPPGWYTFGLMDFGVRANPGPGFSLNLDITNLVFADQFLAVFVPEPNAWLLAVFGGCSVIAFRHLLHWRRGNQG
jgi:hypothetical protein